MKPIMNLDEVEFDDVEENGIYTSRRGQISDHIGARQLGYNLTVLPPGKVQCPFHSHHGEEEMFLILEGEGELRFGDGAIRSAARRDRLPDRRRGGRAPDHQHRHDDDALPGAGRRWSRVDLRCRATTAISRGGSRLRAGRRDERGASTATVGTARRA